MPDLDRHFSYLEDEFAAARAAPLSARKAMLVAGLIDAYADRLAKAAGADVLRFRDGLAAAAPALGLVFALCARGAGGPSLVTEAVDVPLADYSALKVEDFMVSLYNRHSVQRVRVALPNGGRRDVHEVLGEAVEALQGTSSPNLPR